MGGGFGGKETQAGHLAVWAAMAAHKLRCPVKLRLDRDDDFMVTGKRHPFAYEYSAGFDDTGRLTALKLMMAANCGFSADLSGPVADRAIFHSDNAYYLQDVEIASYRCKLNTQSHTAFRGFGGPQGVILIETIMGDIARHLGLDPLDVRLRNLYSDEPYPAQERRDTTHYGMRVEDNILHHCYQNWSRLRSTDGARGHFGLERCNPVIKKRPGHHAGQVRHQLHRHAVQPGRRLGACLHRRQRAGQPRRHRDGPGPEHQGGADRGRRVGRAFRARAVHRQRHQQGSQRHRHGRVGRHRPEWPRGPVCRAPCARQPGRLRLRAGRLRRGCGAFFGWAGVVAQDHPQL
jgi:hypothetical protein